MFVNLYVHVYAFLFFYNTDQHITFMAFYVELEQGYEVAVLNERRVFLLNISEKKQPRKQH